MGWVLGWFSLPGTRLYLKYLKLISRRRVDRGRRDSTCFRASHSELFLTQLCLMMPTCMIRHETNVLIRRYILALGILVGLLGNR